MDAVVGFFAGILGIAVLVGVLIACFHVGLKMLPVTGWLYKAILASGPVKRFKRGFVRRRKRFFSRLGQLLYGGMVWLGSALYRGARALWVRLTA